MAINKNSLKRLKPKSLSRCCGSPPPPPSTKLATTMLFSYVSLANVNQNRNNRVSGMKRGQMDTESHYYVFRVSSQCHCV
jgi:hypothetical protein